MLPELLAYWCSSQRLHWTAGLLLALVWCEAIVPARAQLELLVLAVQVVMHACMGLMLLVQLYNTHHIRSSNQWLAVCPANQTCPLCS